MKQVWQCDFCTYTGEHTKVAAHEAKCVFNPANRKCMTCKHRTDEGAPISGFWNGCALKVANQFDVEDGDADCAKWEQLPDKD
ncbi:hypothetical protein [Neptuniibacter sp. QD37_11]|uniref:hypothetical protein n=1 Tax=Neptuniibacter sp. QD37_11 TaxID=3398209 RepID=UPI0039F46577